MTTPAADQAQRNKQLVIDFYRHVFDVLNPAAVKDFVAEDYYQHCRHMPQGCAGLEAIVTRIAGGAAPLPVQPHLKHSPAFSGGRRRHGGDRRRLAAARS